MDVVSQAWSGLRGEEQADVATWPSLHRGVGGMGVGGVSNKFEELKSPYGRQ